MSKQPQFDPATGIMRAYLSFQSESGGWQSYLHAFVTGVAFGALQGKLTQEEIVQAFLSAMDKAKP